MASSTRVVVVGASAGGVEALRTLVRGLPADLPAAVAVVLHVPAAGRSMLPEILSRVGRLPAAHAQHGDPLVPGRVYVAPPDRHLLVRAGRLELSHGPRENRTRPSVDVLFRSAALACGREVIGVILSGTLDDGAAGLRAIKARGGLAVVQDPADALHAGMPESALRATAVDHVAAVAEMPELLARLVAEPPPAVERPPSLHLVKEAAMAEGDRRLMEGGEHPEPASPFSCPECGGVLYEIADGGPVRFRCRVGHAYGAESLLASQVEGIEDALWTALRALEERIELSRRLHRRAASMGHRELVARYAEQMREADAAAERIRALVLNGGGAETGRTGT